MGDSLDTLEEKFDSKLSDIEKADDADSAAQYLEDADRILGEMASQVGLPLDGDSGKSKDQFMTLITRENGELNTAELAEVYQKLIGKRDDILNEIGL